MAICEFSDEMLIELRATSELLLKSVKSTDLHAMSKEELANWAATASPDSNTLIIDLIDTLIAERVAHAGR